MRDHFPENNKTYAYVQKVYINEPAIYPHDRHQEEMERFSK